MIADDASTVSQVKDGQVILQPAKYVTLVVAIMFSVMKLF